MSNKDLYINKVKEVGGKYEPEKGNGIATLQLAFPEEQKLQYFEVTLQKANKSTPTCYIGLAPGNKAWVTKGHCGVNNGAVGWNGETGGVFNDNASATPTIDRFKVGDTVGCLWNMVKDEVVFTLNGKKQKNFLGARSKSFVGDLYPTITFTQQTQLEFTVNLGKEKFMYDLSQERDPDEDDNDTNPLTELSVNHETEVGKDLAYLYENSTNSDVKIIVGKQSFPGHKIILASRSPWFMSKVFSSDTIQMETKFSEADTLLTLNYIYTGKVKVTQNNWESVLKVADFYGVSGLRRSCFDFMIKSLNKNTVLEVLNKAQNKLYDFDATDLIKRCVIFLEKNAHEVIKTKSFLNLSEDVVIMILKNTNSVFDEVDAFRACIEWGKHQKEVLKKEDDLPTILKNIAQHIRYPLMSPHELIKVVRPTKVAPVDLYTQAVEYHAYADYHAKRIKTDIQFCKRLKSFTGSTLIDERNAAILLSFLPPSPKGWECIYKGTKDGFNTNNFHGKCDNKGETVVVIQSDSGNIFGGYAPQPWGNTNQYTYDTKTFLFSLVNKNGKAPLKIGNNTNNKHSTYNASSYGPTFGGGHDIYICANSNTTKSSYSNLGHSFKLPKYAYGTNEAKNFLAGSYNFLTKEIEVFAKIE